MDILTDLPFNSDTLNPAFEIEEPLQRLQTLLNRQNIDIDNLDDRVDNDMFVNKKESPHTLTSIKNDIESNPMQKLTSKNIGDLNDRYYASLDNSNPSFIFSTDFRTRNNIGLIRNSNQTYSIERDMYAIPPPVDIQQKIYELLSTKK